MSRLTRMSRASKPRVSRATRRGMSTARDVAGTRQSTRDLKKSKRASGGKKGAKKAARASAIDDSARESAASSEASLDERLSIEETSIAELEEESNASWS